MTGQATKILLTICSATTRMSMHQHSIALSHNQLFFLSISFTEYRQIREYHDGAWYPK